MTIQKYRLRTLAIQPATWRSALVPESSHPPLLVILTQLACRQAGKNLPSLRSNDKLKKDRLKILLHEVVHEMLYTKTGSWFSSDVTDEAHNNNMPLWLFEGLPDYISLKVPLCSNSTYAIDAL